MKNVKLKRLDYAALSGLHDLAMLQVQAANPALMRIRTSGHLGPTAVRLQVTTVLCTRMAIKLAKAMAEPGNRVYSLSMGPETAGALMLAYWQYYDQMVPDPLLEVNMHIIHQQLA